MRRGHSGIGGWRSENPRHFRPRSGGPPRFRPPRTYPLLDTARFPPPGHRHRGPHPYHSRHLNDYSPPDHHERNQYRDGDHNNPRGHSSQPRHPHQSYGHPNIRHKNKPDTPYRDSSHFYDDVDSCHVNSLGDIDHRQSGNLHAPDSYTRGMHSISSWANPPALIDKKKHYYENRSPQKNYRHQESNDGHKVPLLEYGGHRPPSSDHYGGTPGPMVNNDNSFSRSVDDTVDIVRRRLMNRNESRRSSEDANIGQLSNDQDIREENNPNTQEEPPTKRRIQRPRQNATKSNCDKIKSKIVHQLFKMDKDKMHKLMDNPSSSTKFEYAISSLITESQISLNRHLRSVAEKSLFSSGSDFIQNDNNTIYEDTFMKQLQCLLDPQDTVLLEDIKPIVMAELSKVLQLDDFDQPQYDGLNDQSAHNPGDDPSNYSYCEQYNYEEYPPETFYDQHQSGMHHENINESNSVEDINYYEYNQPIEYESKPLYERRKVNKRDREQSSLERRQSADSQRLRRSIDMVADEKFKSSEEMPLFDTNTAQLSEEEDPFAELDRQYHVAVDPNFIENDDILSTEQDTPEKLESGSDVLNIKQEIDTQILNIAKSPLKLFSTKDKNEEQVINANNEHIQYSDIAKENNTPLLNSSNSNTKIDQLKLMQEHSNQPKKTEKAIEKLDSSNSIMKLSSPSNTRKRSTDQRPSHRKEKRKKSETSQPESNKEETNTNLNDCTDKPANGTESRNETAKTVYDLFYPKVGSGKEVLKDSKKVEPIDKGYSDKYVKRKDSQRRSKDREKKRNSNSSSHSNVSPKENNNTSKQDQKVKLKTIDMFMDQPKKATLHTAHRNTAPTATTTVKNEELKVKSPPHPAPVTGRKVVNRHVAVQVIKKVQTKTTQTFESKAVTTRFSQTDRNKFLSKLVQTDPVILEKSIVKSSDAFERMKEIDMEIQVLLQEKFKLYSSLESKASCSSSLPALGMTVLNVTSFDENKDDDNNGSESLMSADSIVDEFTNIPVEELEQIALETVQEESEVKVGKKSTIPKIQEERNSSQSPTSSRRLSKRGKTPNISLIEQIITDDRPLEDIISLDDLEGKPTSKNKKRPPKIQAKKKITKKIKASKNVGPTNSQSPYELKDCSIVLIRTDISNYLEKQSAENEFAIVEVEPIDEEVEAMVLCDGEPEIEQIDHVPNEVVEESDVNDLQFDMLDVSEDIVIGDNYEVKCLEDKDGRVPISEEIILDNSQSSCDDVPMELGQINECRMYDYSTDEKLSRESITVTGHAEAVLAIECVENDFIAACLDGNVYHFSNDGQLLNTLRGSNLAVTCLTIVKEKYETTVYTGSLDSRIRYYDLETGLEKGPECNVLSPIQTMDRAWDTIFVGTRTGFVLQFECKNNMLIPVSTVKFSEQSILALRAMKEGPRKVLLVAARSENVTIKDAQTGLLLRTLVGPKMTVYTLLFEDGKVYCGTSSHQIHVFDYSSGSHTACHEGGKGAVCLRAMGGLLFAGCYDGCIYVYREGEPRPLAQLRGPSLMLLSLAVVGSKIIAGYKDKSLYIWKIPLSILQEMIL